MNEQTSGGTQRLGNFRGLIDMIGTIKDLLPFILEIIECFKGMTPDEQETSLNLIARFAGDTDEEREQIKAQLQQLVS